MVSSHQAWYRINISVYTTSQCPSVSFYATELIPRPCKRWENLIRLNPQVTSALLLLETSCFRIADIQDAKYTYPNWIVEDWGKWPDIWDLLEVGLILPHPVASERVLVQLVDLLPRQGFYMEYVMDSVNLHKPLLCQIDQNYGTLPTLLLAILDVFCFWGFKRKTINPFGTPPLL